MPAGVPYRHILYNIDHIKITRTNPNRFLNQQAARSFSKYILNGQDVPVINRIHNKERINKALNMHLWALFVSIHESITLAGAANLPRKDRGKTPPRLVVWAHELDAAAPCRRAKTCAAYIIIRKSAKKIRKVFGTQPSMNSRQAKTKYWFTAHKAKKAKARALRLATLTSTTRFHGMCLYIRDIVHGLWVPVACPGVIYIYIPVMLYCIYTWCVCRAMCLGAMAALKRHLLFTCVCVSSEKKLNAVLRQMGVSTLTNFHLAAQCPRALIWLGYKGATHTHTHWDTRATRQTYPRMLCVAMHCATGRCMHIHTVRSERNSNRLSHFCARESTSRHSAKSI